MDLNEYDFEIYDDMEEEEENSQSLILYETEFNENYEPTYEELIEYAKYIGIDPDIEPELLEIAKEGIKAKLPEPWKACRNATGEIFYVNIETQEASIEHPLDEFFKEKVIASRSQNENGQGFKGFNPRISKNIKKKQPKLLLDNLNNKNPTNNNAELRKNNEADAFNNINDNLEKEYFDKLNEHEGEWKIKMFGKGIEIAKKIKTLKIQLKKSVLNDLKSVRKNLIDFKLEKFCSGNKKNITKKCEKELEDQKKKLKEFHLNKKKQIEEDQKSSTTSALKEYQKNKNIKINKRKEELEKNKEKMKKFVETLNSEKNKIKNDFTKIQNNFQNIMKNNLKEDMLKYKEALNQKYQINESPQMAKVNSDLIFDKKLALQQKNLQSSLDKKIEEFFETNIQETNLKIFGEHEQKLISETDKILNSITKKKEINEKNKEKKLQDFEKNINLKFENKKKQLENETKAKIISIKNKEILEKSQFEFLSVNKEEDKKIKITELQEKIDEKVNILKHYWDENTELKRIIYSEEKKKKVNDTKRSFSKKFKKKINNGNRSYADKSLQIIQNNDSEIPNQLDHTKSSVRYNKRSGRKTYSIYESHKLNSNIINNNFFFENQKNAKIFEFFKKILDEQEIFMLEIKEKLNLKEERLKKTKQDISQKFLQFKLEFNKNLTEINCESYKGKLLIKIKSNLIKVYDKFKSILFLIFSIDEKKNFENEIHLFQEKLKAFEKCKFNFLLDNKNNFKQIQLEFEKYFTKYQNIKLSVTLPSFEVDLNPTFRSSLTEKQEEINQMEELAKNKLFEIDQNIENDDSVNQTLTLSDLNSRSKNINAKKEEKSKKTKTPIKNNYFDKTIKKLPDSMTMKHFAFDVLQKKTFSGRTTSLEKSKDKHFLNSSPSLNKFFNVRNLDSTGSKSNDVHRLFENQRLWLKNLNNNLNKNYLKNCL